MKIRIRSISRGARHLRGQDVIVEAVDSDGKAHPLPATALNLYVNGRHDVVTATVTLVVSEVDLDGVEADVVEKYPTQDDAVRAAILESEPGDEVAVHEMQCATRGGAACDCNPRVLVVGAKA